ncbi:MAG: hypothetical protein AAGA17_01325 [Actinomycetota bacterium]
MTSRWKEWTLLATVGAAILVLGATRQTDDGDASPPSSTTEATVVAPVPTTAPQLLAPADLEDPERDAVSPAAANLTPTTAPVEIAEEVPMDQLLIDEITVGGLIDGMALASDELLGTGPMDLERAAGAERDVEAERAVLTTRGFEEGFSRGFRHDDGGIVLVQIYRFADADGAAAYVLDGAEHLLGRGATPYDVSPLAGALGFTDLDGEFEAHGVTLSVGRHQVLVVVGGPPGTQVPEAARQVALAQHEHLLSLVS